MPGRFEYQWLDAADFPNLDHEFYDETQAALESLGFRWLGDRENLTLTKAFPKLRTFVRMLVSAEGTISSFLYHIQAMTPKGTHDIRAIELGSELSDGTFLVTSNTLQSGPAKTQPGIDSQRHPATTPPAELLRNHRERLRAALENRPGLTVTRILSRDDDLQFQWRMQAVQAGIRRRPRRPSTRGSWTKSGRPNHYGHSCDAKSSRRPCPPARRRRRADGLPP